MPRRLKARLFAILISTILPVVSHAATIEFLALGTYTTPRGTNRFDDARLKVDSKAGFGAGANIFWTPRLSTEITASITRPSANARIGAGAQSDFGTLRMLPVTGTAQFHFAPMSRIDPYIGAGAAYVMFDDLRSTTLASIGVDRIALRDKTAFVANAGVSFGLTDRAGLVLDAKYLPLETSATALSGGTDIDRLDIRVNPLVFSTGLRLRF